MSFTEFSQLVSEISKIPLNEITEESSFRDDLAIDSLQMVNLIVEVSVRYNLDLQSVQSIEDFTSVGKMYMTLTEGKSA